MEFQDLPPCENEETLFARYAALALEKQMDFGDAVGTPQQYRLDMIQGVVAFDEKFFFPIQMLGMYEHDVQQWVWAWANDALELPEATLQDGIALKQYGEEYDHQLLSVGRFDLTEGQMHLIGVIASGLTDANAYYLGRFEGVTMVFTMKSDLIAKASQDNPERMLNVFQHIIDTWDMDYHNAFYCYLLAKGYEVEEQGNNLVGKRNGVVLVGKFDEEYRLVELTSESLH